MSHLSVDTHFLLYSTPWECLENFWPSMLLCLIFRRRASILSLCPTSITSPLIIIPSSFSPWSPTSPVSVSFTVRISFLLAPRFLPYCPRQIHIETCLPCPQCSRSSTSTCCGRERRFWLTWKSTAKWNKHDARAPHNVDWAYGGKGRGRKKKDDLFQSKLGWF